ncbi:Uncharacterised protein [Vibrio cholerae]|nr:Uncharacterised protein [Vibrio cholerae]
MQQYGHYVAQSLAIVLRTSPNTLSHVGSTLHRDFFVHPSPQQDEHAAYGG